MSHEIVVALLPKLVKLRFLLGSKKRGNAVICRVAQLFELLDRVRVKFIGLRGEIGDDRFKLFLLIGR